MGALLLPSRKRKNNCARVRKARVSFQPRGVLKVRVEAQALFQARRLIMEVPTMVCPAAMVHVPLARSNNSNNCSNNSSNSSKCRVAEVPRRTFGILSQLHRTGGQKLICGLHLETRLQTVQLHQGVIHPQATAVIRLCGCWPNHQVREPLELAPQVAVTRAPRRRCNRLDLAASVLAWAGDPVPPVRLLVVLFLRACLPHTRLAALSLPEEWALSVLVVLSRPEHSRVPKNSPMAKTLARALRDLALNSEDLGPPAHDLRRRSPEIHPLPDLPTAT